MEHQSPIATTVVLSPEVVINHEDKGQLAERIERLTGRSKVQVIDVRKVVDSEGRTVSFEVDIR